jgi:nitroreductase
MTSEDLFPRDRPGGAVPPGRQLVEEVLRAALAAPSLYNSQPWRFEVGDAGATIRLSLDAARLLRVADPHARAAHIACGAALFNLRMAAAVGGLRAIVHVIPDSGKPSLLARIQLAGIHRAEEWERELCAAIPRRQTNRGPFNNRLVPPGVRAELADAASAEGAILLFPGHDEAARLRRLAVDAERDLLTEPDYLAELALWVSDDRQWDGIPASALGPRSPEGREPVRSFGRARAGETRYAWFEENPQLAVISVRLGGPREWLAAGQALERTWLMATCRGVSVCPLTQPLETRDAWLVRTRQSGVEQPQMILRIGYGLPIAAGALRRPLAEVTDWIPADD